jgi:hypothetical protein
VGKCVVYRKYHAGFREGREKYLKSGNVMRFSRVRTAFAWSCFGLLAGLLPTPAWCGRAPDQGVAHDYGELCGVPRVFIRARGFARMQRIRCCSVCVARLCVRECAGGGFASGFSGEFVSGFASAFSSGFVSGFARTEINVDYDQR